MAANDDNLVRRREILAAYVAAFERREELLRICADVPGDDASAVAAVAEAFEVSDLAATAILDLQVRRFTPESFVQIRAQLADVDRQLADASS
jgi:DNA gyrase/topoisomerase IV subunit A